MRMIFISVPSMSGSLVGEKLADNGTVVQMYKISNSELSVTLSASLPSGLRHLANRALCFLQIMKVHRSKVRLVRKGNDVLFIQRLGAFLLCRLYSPSSTFSWFAMA
jgi:hypothetical protein